MGRRPVPLLEAHGAVMAGLFIQLDVEYASDDEFIEAGPMAELLFVRGLCFMKRKKTDGKVKRVQLPNVAGNIPNAAKHAQSLVTVGLWEVTQDGWYCPSYLKRNPSKADIELEQEMAKEAGEKGNHERWHIGADGKPSAKCRLCRADRIAPPIAPPMGAANRVGSPETETEEETQTEPETETTTPSSQVTQPADPAPGDDRLAINKIILLVAEKRRGEYCKSSDPEVRETYLAKTITKMNRHERDAITAMLQERPHMLNAIELAAEFYEASKAAS